MIEYEKRAMIEAEDKYTFRQSHADFHANRVDWPSPG